MLSDDTVKEMIAKAKGKLERGSQNSLEKSYAPTPSSKLDSIIDNDDAHKSKAAKKKEKKKEKKLKEQEEKEKLIEQLEKEM
mmetsp:Transcript_14742/g.12562  ORF Transcript_14742/g.12562 Transcript_14742/m.12562 type:complete len:82 (+) Transcript_14742:700-945(+)